MKKLMLGIAVVALVALHTPAAAQQEQGPPMPDPGQGYAVLNEGNSLMGQLHIPVELPGLQGRMPLIQALSRLFGYPEHETMGFGAAGIPIDWAWENLHKRDEFFEKVQRKEWEMLTVQPYGYHLGRTPEDEAGAAAQFYRHVLAQNPEAPLLVYQTWPGGKRGELAEGGGDTEAYLKRLNDRMDDHMIPLLHILRQEFPDKPVYQVPVPQAFAEFAHRIETDEGKALGFEHVAQLLDAEGRSVHVSPMGLYLNAMTHLASYYRKSPVGAGLPHEYTVVFAFDRQAGPQPTGLSPEAARFMQQIAWDVVSREPATPVTRTPLPLEDTHKPQPAELKEKDVLGARQVRLTWQPGSDNDQVLRQAVYRNGTYLDSYDPEASALTVSGLNPGEKNVITVRTLDASYNLADLDVEVTPPALVGDTVLLGWDLSHYSGRPNARERYKHTSDVTVTEGTGTVAKEGTLSFGPGLKLGSRPFRGMLLMQGTDSKTLAEAIENDDYIGFQVVPEAGQTLSLGSLLMPFQPRGEENHLTVMASANGFDAGQEIYDLQFTRAEHFVEFPLHRSEALQEVKDAVEIRLYVWGDIPQFYLGNFRGNGEELDIILYGSVK